MKRKRLFSAVCGLAMLGQAFAAMPPMQAAAAVSNDTQTLTQFAAKVQEITAADNEKELFTKIIYDEKAGTLSADGKTAKASCGDLTVRSGRLLLKTGKTAGGLSVKEGSAYERFEDAAEESGYTFTENDGKLTITNEFQTARLIVKAAEKIPHYGEKNAVEGYNDLHILQYETPAEAYAAYQKYQDDPAVEYVQPSHRVQLDETADAVSEAYVNALLDDTGDGKYNTWGAPLLGTEEFISKYLNNEVLPEVVVAVIDTGINDKPALFEGRILEGGINISNSGNDTVNDDLYHGTHVSGTICELTPHNVKILPVKVFDKGGSASDEQIYLGLMFALEQNADILNMSFGGLGVSPLEVEAMNIADKNGIICCAAAGNNADDAGYYYPGSIESCITVGAVDQQMERAPFSNTGNALDIVAPGVGIVSYGIGSADKKEAKNGTSMATPHASACCALLRSYKKDMTPANAEALLRVNAKDLGKTGFDKDFGWGFLNMSVFHWEDGICREPQFSLKSGNYGTAQTVTLSTPTEGGSIYYTTDGSYPTRDSALYEEPLLIEQTTWIRAVTVRDFWVTSAEAEGVYMIGGEDTADAFTVKDGVIEHYSGVQETLTVPSVINGETITGIAPLAFADNHFIRDIVLPDSITEIPAHTFRNCKALERVYGLNVKQIGEDAFRYDTALTTVAFSDALNTIGKSAFYRCTSLKSLSFSEVKTLPKELCEGCSALETADFPNATVVQENAFKDCASLTRVNLPWEKVTVIGNSAFEGCPLWKGDLSLTALETLGDRVFCGDSALLRVALSENITVLPESTFDKCAGLRLLLLPAVKAIGSRALATGNPYSGLQTDLNYSQITRIGAEAFSGFSIGNGYETVTFSALPTLTNSAFAGVSAGGLSFPNIKTVISSAFTGSDILCAYLENAETFKANSLSGVKSVVMTAAAKEIAENALPENIWVVTLDQIPALESVKTKYSVCTEPLVMRSNSDVALSQHETGRFYVLAGGIDLKYQWYQVSGETKTLLEGETAPFLTPDTSQTGTFSYLCVITDKSRITEEVKVKLTVDQKAKYEPITTETLYYASGTASQFRQFTPETDGTYRLITEGAADAMGVLTDGSGKIIAELQSLPAGSAVLSAALKAGETYYIETVGRWDGKYALMLTNADVPEKQISDCALKVTVQSAADYGSGYLPTVVVRSPEGKTLTENTDYTLVITPHNQYDRIGVYGIGSYTGYTETTVSVISRIPEDTPIPVTLDSDLDTAVYAFIPKVGGTYHFYATPADGYAAEYAAYNRAGRYVGGSMYVGIRTHGIVADTADGSENILAENEYSSVTGNYFNDTVTLNAGQTYYFLCSAYSKANYSLVVSQETHDIRTATVTGSFSGTYEDGERYLPKIKVKLGDKELKEGTDYLRVDTNNDIPGHATVAVIGMGLYYGRVERTYDMVYTEPELPEKFLKEDETVRVTCADSRLTTLWFEVKDGESPNDTTRYRIINKRVSGGKMQYQLFTYLPEFGICSRVNPSSKDGGDFRLKNGIYCITVTRIYADLASSADFTVLKPYSLADARLTISNQPYTGSPVPTPVIVTAPDGTVLKEDFDYTVFYSESNIMFGTVHFSIRPTDRSFGTQTAEFEIYVDLPEDAPEIEVGEHEVTVSFTDRLAIYKLTADINRRYLLGTSDVANIVLRVFSPDAEMLGQAYGSGTKSLNFDVPADETRYLMIKFNGENREGTIHFKLDTTSRILSECTIIKEPQLWTGSRIEPDIKFMDGDYTLVEGVDYELRYTADDVNVGTATANYIGMGDYFGICDVTYDIILPNLEAVKALNPVPLLLNEVYDIDNFKMDYPAFFYEAGLPTDLKIAMFSAQCNGAMQIYNAEGEFVTSMPIRPDGELMQTAEPLSKIYIVISPTDISGSNRSFKLLLTDEGNPQLKTVEDKEGGVFYRVSEEDQYAEVYYTDKERSKLIISKTINDIPVAYMPEAIFAELPPDTVVIGYDGCPAADYANRYPFIYQQATGTNILDTGSGDINGDGKITQADVTLLSAFLNENPAIDPNMIESEYADINQDSSLDLMDLLMLMTMI